MNDFQEAIAMGLYDPSVRSYRQVLIDKIKRRNRDPWKVIISLFDFTF